MRLLADMHISPRTVDFLRSSGHDAVRVNEVLSARATDGELIDLGCSGRPYHPDPGFGLLRAHCPLWQSCSLGYFFAASSSRIDFVNALLERFGPWIPAQKHPPIIEALTSSWSAARTALISLPLTMKDGVAQPVDGALQLLIGPQPKPTTAGHLLRTEGKAA